MFGEVQPGSFSSSPVLVVASSHMVTSPCPNLTIQKEYELDIYSHWHKEQLYKEKLTVLLQCPVLSLYPTQIRAVYRELVQSDSSAS